MDELEQAQRELSAAEEARGDDEESQRLRDELQAYQLGPV